MSVLHYSSRYQSGRVPVQRRLPLTRQPVFDRIPVTQRRAVTREYLAATVGRGTIHPMQERMDMPTLLHNGIVKLVYKNANSYAVNSRDSVDDLAQACLLNIWKRLHTYNPKKGAFSTWVWHVCRSVLNGRYSRDRKHTKNLSKSGSEALEQVSHDDDNHCSVNGQITDAIDFLFERYPKMSDVLTSMFGERHNCAISDKICVAQIARDTGRKYSDVYRFFRGPVQRVFADFLEKPQPRRGTHARRRGRRRNRRNR